MNPHKRHSAAIIIASTTVLLHTTIGLSTPPPLTARDTGVYGITAWGSPSTPPNPGSTEDRTDKMTFTIRSIWNNAGNPNPNLSNIVQEVNDGWGYANKRTQLVRVNFWDGSDRYEGTMLDKEVYLARVLHSVAQLESVHDKIHGITLAEENVPTGGRTQLLQYLYEGVKAQYPDLPVYQWWTPNTPVPQHFEGTWLSADGWVFDPYTLTEHHPAYTNLWAPDPYLRLMQKYTVSGLPIVAIAAATAETPFRPYYDVGTTPYLNSKTQWDVNTHQTSINTAFNVPTAFYWSDVNGGAYFPTVTSDPLLNNLTDYVQNFADTQAAIPTNYKGNAAIADVWSNGNDKVLPVTAQTSRNIVFEEKFSESDFLDMSKGSGLRDLIVNGQDLRTHGFDGRNANAEIIYHFESTDFLNYPLIALHANINSGLNGVARLYVSSDGVNWSATNQTATNGSQLLQLSTQGLPQFASVQDLWVKVKLEGDPGTFDQPAVRIDNLRVLQNSASMANTLLNVNFDTNYATGPLHGQGGGVNGGNWKASNDHGLFEIVDSNTASENAAKLSRSSSLGEARIALETPLDTGSSSIVFGFDFMRPDDSAQGDITLRNSASGNNTGIGIELRSGSGQAIRYLVDAFSAGAGATQATSIIPVDGAWYSVEFEINGVTKKYDMYLNLRGTARTLVAANVSWNAANALVDEFYYLPQGMSESNIYIDNLWLMSSQPQAYAVPEPSTAIAALAAAGMLAMRRRIADRPSVGEGRYSFCR